MARRSAAQTKVRNHKYLNILRFEPMVLSGRAASGEPPLPPQLFVLMKVSQEWCSSEPAGILLRWPAGHDLNHKVSVGVGALRSAQYISVRGNEILG